MKHIAMHALAAAALLAAGAAQAQSAGTWMVHIGATTIDPQVSSGNLTAPSLPNTQVDVKKNTQLSGGIGYMLSDQWAVQVPLALPYRHDIVGAGAIAGAGKLGDVNVVPATVFVQYFFGAPGAKVRPYLGVGPTYAKSYHERSTGTLSALTGGNPTTFSVDSRWGVTAEAGATIAFGERYFVDLMVGKTLLKTTTHLSTGQQITTKLDPLVLSVGVGMSFR
ncbi:MULTISPECIES: OmpW family outer membrane protein [Ramlibacter]|uniref:OmpW family protein n=1 Tax=Ramlibacter aquaticus TaxID=2780094 RepID=A0ABR9SFN4_9BURK|nr:MULTISPECIES: OmpW family outer membrane protein [Ramlibacter]MBE7940882.1 OmpW family protein [Ramlibacter aquaticus]